MSAPMRTSPTARPGIQLGTAVGFVRWHYSPESLTWKPEHNDGFNYLGATDTHWIAKRHQVVHYISRLNWEMTIA